MFRSAFPVQLNGHVALMFYARNASDTPHSTTAKTIPLITPQTVAVEKKRPSGSRLAMTITIKYGTLAIACKHRNVPAMFACNAS